MSLQLVLECSQVLLGGSINIERMDTQRVRPMDTMGQLSYRLEIGTLDCRNQKTLNASRMGPCHNVIAIRIKLRGVEVAVRVDPHQSRGR
jgi:hypothetical protein